MRINVQVAARESNSFCTSYWRDLLESPPSPDCRPESWTQSTLRSLHTRTHAHFTLSLAHFTLSLTHTHSSLSHTHTITHTHTHRAGNCLGPRILRAPWQLTIWTIGNVIINNIHVTWSNISASPPRGLPLTSHWMSFYSSWCVGGRFQTGTALTRAFTQLF